MNKVKQEPAAWIIRHPHFCGKFTDDKEVAEYWENKEQGCTVPLDLHPQPAFDEAHNLAIHLQSLLDMQDEDCRYDHQGYCQNHNLDHIDVGCRVQKARTALTTYHSLLQDCLDFALDVPECGCAHSRACSSCERYREAQRLAERLAERLVEVRQ